MLSLLLTVLKLLDEGPKLSTQNFNFNPKPAGSAKIGAFGM